MTRQLFVNLPVADLERSKAFFAGLGFAFDAKFTDEKAACMIVEPDRSYVMLLSRPFFQGFTKKDICDSATHVEALMAFSCPTREAVTEMVEKALASGGAAAMDPQDHGFMFSWSFQDPDGHCWEPLWMDEAAAAEMG